MTQFCAWCVWWQLFQDTPDAVDHCGNHCLQHCGGTAVARLRQADIRAEHTLNGFKFLTAPEWQQTKHILIVWDNGERANLTAFYYINANQFQPKSVILQLSIVLLNTF